MTQSRNMVKRTRILLFLHLLFTGMVPGSNDGYGDAVTYLRQNAISIGISAEDLRELTVSSAHFDQSTGLHHIYIQQLYQEVAVEGALANLVREKGGRIRLINHNLLAGLSQIPVQIPVLSAEDIHQMVSPMTKKPVLIRGLLWTKSGNRWHLVFDVRLEQPEHFWRLWVSATDGSILKQQDLILHCWFDVSATADCISFQENSSSVEPHFTAEESYLVYPHPVESPAHGDRQLVLTPADPVASPLGWHDIDGLAGPEFTDTRGNNTFTQHDLMGNDLTVSRPESNNLSFSYPLDFEKAPQDNLDASVTNLFYWNNLNHDIFYHYGFDEAAGNFQVNNYNRGGLGGDQVYADAQDGSDRNNARFIVMEDGIPARMQMYLWNAGLYDAFIELSQPDGSILTINAVESGFSRNNKLISTVVDSLEIIRLFDTEGNTSLACLDQPIANASEIDGKIVLIERGSCFFIEKVKRLELLGARGVIICNNVPGEPIIMGGEDQTITIPAVMISMDQCAILENLIKVGNLYVDIRPQNDPGALDSALDNLIITHEYGHGISSRLVGGANTIGCLDNAEQMGEGWSDYFGLMLTTNWKTARPEDPRGIGTFVSSQSPTGRGIRNYPYSTNRLVNPLTYDDLSSSPLTHAVGAIWCTMLWDMTWEIIKTAGSHHDVYVEGSGNQIALRLVVESLKLMRCYPGFIDGRDAILQADSLLYQGRHHFAIWKAFAGRGLGYSADQANSFSTFDGRSGYDLPDHFRTAIADFFATEQGNHIDLDFSTLREYDNLRFTLQRSTDGVHYNTIQEYEGRNLEPGSRNFHYEDLDVHRGQLYYYRLLNTEASGAENLLGQDSAILIPVTDLVIFPNPTDGITSIKINRSIQGPVQLNLYTVTGQNIWKNRLEASDLYIRHFLDFSTLKPGVYFLDCQMDDQHFRRKVMIH
jgi:extracellular elastinolytic metalloproteinase